MNILRTNRRSWNTWGHGTSNCMKKDSERSVASNCFAFIHLSDWHESKRHRTASRVDICAFLQPASSSRQQEWIFPERMPFNGFEFNWMCKQKGNFCIFPQCLGNVFLFCTECTFSVLNGAQMRLNSLKGFSSEIRKFKFIKDRRTRVGHFCVGSTWNWISWRQWPRI